MTTGTKVKISLGQDAFEIEGSEEFVTRHLDELKAIIGIGEAAPEARKGQPPKRKRASTTPSKKAAAKAKPKGKAKAKKVAAERFDIHGEGETPSLKDFLDEKKPGRANGTRIAVIGYYITELLGEESFSEGQVEYAYKMLKLKRPNHLHQIMINNKNENDYYEQVEESESTWRLSRAGEIFVGDQLPSVDE